MKDKRCSWCAGSELYIDYHDKEWGVPCYDGRELFELLNLEGAQAGLSWITILNKREHYRKVFAGFEPAKLARFSQAKIDKLVLDPGIVRHKGKITSVVSNAKIYLEMEKNGEPFADFLWQFADYKPSNMARRSMKSVPASTEASMAMSKALKKRGFKFVGSTICYAFMQACGMVNDHLVSCPSHAKVEAHAKKRKRPKHWPK
jgi:DNA-3-methyladenine glycosylase I